MHLGVILRKYIFPHKSEDLPNIEHKINYDDPISSLEKKVFMVSKPIGKHYIEINSPFFEKNLIKF